MTLTTHTIIASAITRPISHIHPALTFIVALTSHYLADAIPHWDYQPESIERGKKNESDHMSLRHPKFLRDFFKIAFDGLLGLGIVWLLTRPSTPEEYLWMTLAAVGGCLPDFLLGVHMASRWKFLEPLHEFHNRVHTKIKLGPYPLIGIPFQLAILFTAIYFLI